MPKGLYFRDKDSNVRNEIRIRWWKDPANSSYQEMSVLPLENLPEATIHESLTGHIKYYSEDERPVFFGHYWLTGTPRLLRENICCLDFSVAKHGFLTAYRFNGEKVLKNENFVYV